MLTERLISKIRLLIQSPDGKKVLGLSDTCTFPEPIELEEGPVDTHLITSGLDDHLLELNLRRFIPVFSHYDEVAEEYVFTLNVDVETYDKRFTKSISSGFYTQTICWRDIKETSQNINYIYETSIDLRY